MKVTVRRMVLEIEDIEMDVTPNFGVDNSRIDKGLNYFPTIEEVSARIKARLAERFGHGPGNTEGFMSPGQ